MGWERSSLAFQVRQVVQEQVQEVWKLECHWSQPGRLPPGLGWPESRWRGAGASVLAGTGSRSTTCSSSSRISLVEEKLLHRAFFQKTSIVFQFEIFLTITMNGRVEKPSINVSLGATVRCVRN